MAITQAMCTSFKDQLLEGAHDFRSSGGDTFKLALYTSSAALDATTTAYSATNEVGNSGSYSAGGGTLTTSLRLLRAVGVAAVLVAAADLEHHRDEPGRRAGPDQARRRDLRGHLRGGRSLRGVAAVH